MGANAYKCPEGYTACSTATSKNNTICVAPSEKANNCPLTFIKFIRVDQEDEYSNSTDYKVQTVNEDYSLVTSKTKGDSLPYTSFRIENKPCLDSRDTSRSASSQFYPLERDRTKEDCRTVAQFNQRYDDRYQNLGLEISEYDVQDESEVLDDLEDLPNLPMYVNL